MPRIYIACLAAYNQGLLHGEWIDASTDVEEMQNSVDRILRTSPCPNVMVECPECEGSGEGVVRNVETKEDHDCECQWCGGTGEVPSAEEFAIHDHEGLGNIGEYTPLEEIADLVEIAECGIEPRAALAYAAEYDVSADEIRDNYRGQYTSWADFAQELEEESGGLDEVPDRFRYHIDWESIGREFETGGGLVEFDGHFFFTP